MKWGALLIAAVVVAQPTPRPASAQEAAETQGTGKGQKAQGASQPVLVVPALTIQGNTKGKASFSVSGDFRWGASDIWDLAVAPSAQIQTENGTTSVLTVTENADERAFHDAPPWRLGLQLQALKMWKPCKQNDRERLLGPLRAGVEECKRSCNSHAEGCDVFDKAWQKALSACKEPPQSNVSPKECAIQRMEEADLCTSGKSVLDQAGRKLDRLSDSCMRSSGPPLPQGALSVAALTGREQVTFLSTTSSPGVLQERDRAEEIWLLSAYGYSMFGLQGSRAVVPSLEARVGAERTFKAPSETAQFCQDAGTVGAGGPTAMSCTTLPLGNAEPQWTVAYGGDVGLVEKDGGRWRTALGLGGIWSKKSLAVTLELPIYIDLTKVARAKSDSYRGLVRLTARAQGAVRGDAFGDFTLVLELALLGERDLFPNALSIW